MKNRRAATKCQVDTLLVSSNACLHFHNKLILLHVVLVVHSQVASLFLLLDCMKETRPGVFARVQSPFIEVRVGKADSYDRKAAHSCRLKKQHGKKICLFKLNGAMILNEPLKIKKKNKPWTIGNYLLLTKKSASTTKLGVSYADNQQNVSS